MKKVIIFARVGATLRNYLKTKGYSTHSMNVYSGTDKDFENTILFAKQFTDFITVDEVEGNVLFQSKDTIFEKV